MADKAEPLCHVSHGECRRERNDSSIIPQDVCLCTCNCAPISSVVAGGHSDGSLYGEAGGRCGSAAVGRHLHFIQELWQQLRRGEEKQEAMSGSGVGRDFWDWKFAEQ